MTSGSGEAAVMLSDEALRPLFTRLRRLGELSLADAVALSRLPWTTERMRSGDFLVRENGRPQSCTLLLSGIVARDRTTGAGTRQISGFCIPGDLVDLPYALTGCAHDNLTVCGVSMIARIPIVAITALIAERPSIARLLWIDTLVSWSIAREWTLSIGRRDARTRLLHLLCELAVRYEDAGLGRPNELTLPLTQEQLADALGLTSVHVNRVMQLLRAETAIERVGRTIRIKDWRLLKKIADFDDAYLHTRAVI